MPSATAPTCLSFAPKFAWMVFEKVVGLAGVKQQLGEMLSNNRLSHALLFLGKEGTGALPLALEFAKLIVAQPWPKQDSGSLFGPEPESQDRPAYLAPEAVVRLPGYQRAEQLIHPDLHFTFPVIPKKEGQKPISSDYLAEWREFVKKSPYANVYDWLQFIGAENKQGNITAEECNYLIRQLNLKSFESPFKVHLIWMPEYLRKEGNKLLKLIEEPPVNTVFLLVAENEEDILPTILSRCQLVKVPKLSKQEIEAALINNEGATQAIAAQIAAIAEGSYREALQLLKNTDEDWQPLLRDWLNNTLKGGPAAQVKFTDELAKLGREKQKQFLRYFNHLIGQAIRVKVLGPTAIPMADAEMAFAQRLNKVASASQMNAIVKELDNASYYIERNANAKMLFLSLTIKIFHIVTNDVVLEQ